MSYNELLSVNIDGLWTEGQPIVYDPYSTWDDGSVHKIEVRKKHSIYEYSEHNN